LKRRLFAAAWITGATVPLLLGTVFVIGCCALPFHNVLHKLMPLCEMAASVMRGDFAAHDRDATPAPEKKEPVKRMVTEVPRPFRLAADTAGAMRLSTPRAAAYRSFITLGAVRCDQDVGLHVLVETFLI
jgi:hypothetical protein